MASALPLIALATAMLRIVLSFFLYGLGDALRLGVTSSMHLSRSSSSLRHFPAHMDGTEKKCALIELSAEEPIRLAQILKKAWMEGGIKRGLVGSVLVGEDSVQIACQGQAARLQSFADWIETTSMLVKDVRIVDSEECPTVSLSNKFPLADASEYSGAQKGSFAGELAEQLKTLSSEIKSKRGKTHSSDEGLA